MVLPNTKPTVPAPSQLTIVPRIEKQIRRFDFAWMAPNLITDTASNRGALTPLAIAWEVDPCHRMTLQLRWKPVTADAATSRLKKSQ